MAILTNTKRLLWSRAGGYCQNPECHDDLFVYFQDGTISNIEELAHIIAQNQKGPRGQNNLDTNERNEYDNIILLCPKCHTLIDKNPAHFPTELLHHWKKKHEESIKALFNVPIFDNRHELKENIHELLCFNKMIFLQYGPHSPSAKSLLSDSATTWKRYVLTDIIPNNRKIRKLLKANFHLLQEDEKDIFNKFVLHQEAFEFNHISGNKTTTAPLFPEKMNEILRS